MATRIEHTKEYFYGALDKSIMYPFPRESYDNLIYCFELQKNGTAQNQGEVDPIYFENIHLIEPELILKLNKEIITHMIEPELENEHILCHVSGVDIEPNQYGDYPKIYMFEYDDGAYKLCTFK